MRRTSALRVMREVPVTETKHFELLSNLCRAADSARSFAESKECKSTAQKLRWLAYADSLTAQVQSLKAEVC